MAQNEVKQSGRNYNEQEYSLRKNNAYRLDCHANRLARNDGTRLREGGADCREAIILLTITREVIPLESKTNSPRFGLFGGARRQRRYSSSLCHRKYHRIRWYFLLLYTMYLSRQSHAYLPIIKKLSDKYVSSG